MSEPTIETPIRRGPGRPRKNPLPIKPQTPAPEPQTVSVPFVQTLPLQPPPAYTMTASTSSISPFHPTIRDEDLEDYGGDIVAWDSVGINQRTGQPNRLARRGDYLPGATEMYLPNLMAPGTLVHRDAPDTRFHFAWWEDAPNKASRRNFVTFKARGYKPVLASEFVVHPDLRDTLLPDVNGRITFAASKDGSHVAMYQSEETYRHFRKTDLAQSDNVAKSAEERAAEMEERLGRSGLNKAKTSSLVEYITESR